MLDTVETLVLIALEVQRSSGFLGSGVRSVTASVVRSIAGRKMALKGVSLERKSRRRKSASNESKFKSNAGGCADRKAEGPDKDQKEEQEGERMTFGGREKKGVASY